MIFTYFSFYIPPYLKPGAQLEGTVENGKVIMIPQASHTSRLFGKHRQLWQNIDAVEYIRN